MLVKDLYELFEIFSELEGITIIKGDETYMYCKEALEMCYINHSKEEIDVLEYKNKYFTVQLRGHDDE